MPCWPRACSSVAPPVSGALSSSPTLEVLKHTHIHTLADACILSSGSGGGATQADVSDPTAGGNLDPGSPVGPRLLQLVAFIALITSDRCCSRGVPQYT